MPEAEVAQSFLKLSNDSAVARIVLDRPPLNILNLEMIRELNRALRDLRAETTLRALVIAAEGRAFSAGVAVEDHLPERVTMMLGAFHDVFRQLRKLHCPVISVVQGAALGGGCELASFADLVIASEAASFGQPEVKLGVFPPVAAVHLPQRIGRSRALRLLLSGEVLNAQEAERIGLSDWTVPAAELEAVVDALVAQFRGMSAPALHFVKRAVLTAASRDFDAGLDAVEDLFLSELMRTSDAVEGLRAFLEKRPALWQHQ